MTKKGRSRKRNAKEDSGSRIRIIDRDTDGIYDEVDRFHMNYDEKLLKLVRKPKKPIAKEVLRIISDDDDDYKDEFYEISSSQHDQKGTTNKWGKSRENYYGTSNKERRIHDGIDDSEEEEILELEEEDALLRQRKIELANSHVDLDQCIQSSTTSYSQQEMLADILQIHERIDDDTNESSTGNVNSNVISHDNNYMSHFEENDVGENDEAVDSDEGEQKIDLNRERRGITYEIRKNKGIRKDKGRRKGKQHSRVMKRIQYKKALIKKRSQVPDVQRELKKYDGEKRGIRISTIRSIKL